MGREVKPPIGIVGQDRAGWFVQWQPSGFRSAMPDQQTALVTAAAADLLAGCKGMLRAFCHKLPDPVPFYMMPSLQSDVRRAVRAVQAAEEKMV